MSFNMVSVDITQQLLWYIHAIHTTVSLASHFGIGTLLCFPPQWGWDWGQRPQSIHCHESWWSQTADSYQAHPFPILCITSSILLTTRFEYRVSQRQHHSSMPLPPSHKTTLASRWCWCAFTSLFSSGAGPELIIRGGSSASATPTSRAKKGVAAMIAKFIASGAAASLWKE